MQVGQDANFYGKLMVWIDFRGHPKTSDEASRNSAFATEEHETSTRRDILSIQR